VGGHHTDGAPRLDFLDKLSQTTGNAQAPDRESVRHACLWKATIMLFSRHKVGHEKKRKIVRNVASVAGLKKSFFAEIDKVEAREASEELRMLKERTVREVGYGMSLEGASAADLVKSMRAQNEPIAQKGKVA
jgi:hypothetical protein